MPKGMYIHKSGYKRPPISEEWRNNLSEAHKGKIPWNKGLEGFLSGIKHYRFGTHISEEMKIKISQSRKGKCSENEHWAWKGAYAGYRALHYRLGKTSNCSMCGDVGGKHGCHWANISGKYDDKNDYICLCPKCHKDLDTGKITILKRRAK